MWRGDGKWRPRDKLLAMAFEIYQTSLCPGCGFSQLITADPDYDGHFRMHAWTCMNCKAIEQYEESVEGKKKRRPGEKRSTWMKLFNPNAPKD